MEKKYHNVVAKYKSLRGQLSEGEGVQLRQKRHSHTKVCMYVYTHAMRVHSIAMYSIYHNSGNFHCHVIFVAIQN